MNHLTEDAVWLRDRRFDATRFFGDFNGEDDLFTLNIAELKELWVRYKKDRGLV